MYMSVKLGPYLRERYRFRVSENKVLRETFGPEKIHEACKNYSKRNFVYKPHPLSNTITVIKERQMR
jgi:hypothetical protein